MLAVQTLGEEYTDIWEYSFDGRTPSRSLRAALILLPTLPSYALARWGSHIGALSPRMSELLKALQVCLEVGTEINLALFYLRGTYYDLVKRVLRIRHVGRVSSFQCTRNRSRYLVTGVFHPREPSCSPAVIFIAWNTHCDTPSPPTCYIFAQ